MKHARLALAATLALPLLCALQWQQQGLDSLDQIYPGPFADADFREVVAGEFTGDLELDAALIDGGALEIAIAPEAFKSRLSTGTYPTAWAVLPGVVAGKDLLLVADELGLRSLELDVELEEWDVTTLFDDNSDWTGAVELAVGDLDGADGLDVAAIDSAGGTVLIAYGAGDGSFVEGDPIALVGPPAFALRLLNWRETGDTSGADEIAVGSAIGVGVLEDGSWIDSMTLTSPNLKMVVIDDVGTAVQRLVLHGKANGIDYLRLYGDTQTTSWFSIGTPGVVSLAAGDADEDGDTELFLSVTSERKVWMLESYSPATPTFVAANVQKFTFGPNDRDPAWNQAGLAIADFDSDGAADVLAPAQGGSLPIGGGAFIPVHGTLPVVQLGNGDPGQWRVTIGMVTFNTETRNLGVLLEEPESVLPSGPGAETKLQVSVWRTPALGQPTIAQAYHSSLVAVPDPGTFFFMALPEGYSPVDSPDVFSFVVRQVSVLDGEIVAQASALTALFVSETNAALIGGADETTVFIPGIIYPDSVTPVGGMGGGPTVPPVPDNELPKR